MKIKSNYLLLVLFFLQSTYAQDETYGSGADVKAAIAVDTILARPGKYLEQTITVAGEVVSVCGKKGCWMMMSAGNERLRIKVKDGEMVFPFNAKGKKAFATGKLEVMDMTRKQSVAYLKHMAEDAGEYFDSTQVTKDLTFYQLRPVGVTILK